MLREQPHSQGVPSRSAFYCNWQTVTVEDNTESRVFVFISFVLQRECDCWVIQEAISIVMNLCEFLLQAGVAWCVKGKEVLN